MQKSHMKSTVYILFIIIFQIFISCSEEDEINTTENHDAVIIVSAGNILSTPSIETISEGRILVLNYSNQAIHIKRQSAPDEFDGETFSESEQAEALVPSQGSAFIQLPILNAGEIIYFYCDIFRESMNPPNGEIVIVNEE